MGISTRTRFEIFKRDRFTCHYCGRTPPAVLLEADHVLPRVAGGTDDVENLITSCQDCNRGKAGNLLDEGSAPTVSQEAIDDLAERVSQAKAYAELTQTYRSLETQIVQRVTDAWADAFSATAEETDGRSVWRLHQGGSWPKDSSIRAILRRLPLPEVLDAVDIACSWSEGYSSNRTCRYFYGVCWSRIRERGGMA